MYAVIMIVSVLIPLTFFMVGEVIRFLAWLELEKEKELQQMLKQAEVKGAAVMAKRQNRFMDSEGNVDLIQCRNYIRKMERQQKMKIESIQFEVIE